MSENNIIENPPVDTKDDNEVPIIHSKRRSEHKRIRS